MIVAGFNFSTLIHGLIGCLLWTHTAGMAQTPPTTPVQERPGDLTWIERPWNARYFIYVEPEIDWNLTKEVSTESNAKRLSKKPTRRFFTWAELFDLDHLVKTKVPDASGNPNLAVVMVAFDHGGMVTSPNNRGKPLKGRINRLGDLGLSDGEALDDRFYYMAHWFTGIGDPSTDWAPAFCSVNQQPDAAMVKSDTYLYGKLFKPNGYSPLFGCREWAYQLYDNERPYIDVTSYEPTSKGKPPKGYIREFIGWARFGDNKPIIGQHEGDWYCLHDCPGGDKPGVIPDIKAWAKRFEWFAPVPPTRVPTFPDPPAKSGTYPYEQRPLSAPGSSAGPQVKKGAKSVNVENEFPDVQADLGC